MSAVAQSIWAANRNAGIDASRAAVTLLVVFHHAALTYGAIGGWYYREIAPSNSPESLLLVLFCTVNQAWFMGFFFLLAGYYTPGAFTRHGVRSFVRDRLGRLAIPLTVYAILIHPITVALSATAQGRPFLSTLVSLWLRRRLEPGPLWFAEALLLFTTAWLLWRSVRVDRVAQIARRTPNNSVLLAGALVAGVTTFAIRLKWPIGTNLFFLQLGYFPSYILLFAAGCAVADTRWLERVCPAQVRSWVVVAGLALPVLPVMVIVGTRVPELGGPAEGGWTVPALTYALWEPFVGWGTILGLLTLFQKQFGTRSTGLPIGLRRLARRAYLIFIIHPPILVATTLVWRGISAPGLLKWLVSGSVACLLCYLAAGLLLRLPGVAKVA